jgi:CRISPR system Cascade subunit CasD
MVTGMLGNALGYSHSDSVQLQALQERVSFACRCDRRGTRKRDYQTVDLGLPHMNDELGWTTNGQLQQRKGGSASTGIHIRLRDYWADSAHTLALTLDPADENPTLKDVAQALRTPERPLFIGRKNCLPAAPIFLDHVQAESLVEALEKAPLPNDPDSKSSLNAWWPAESSKSSDALPVTDERDWANQIHVGERWIKSGKIKITSKEVGNG